MYPRSTAENNWIDEARDDGDRRSGRPESDGRDSDRTRDCDRCGRPRPVDPTRFTVTASDLTDATADYEQALLCAECWRHMRDELRRCLA